MSGIYALEKQLSEGKIQIAERDKVLELRKHPLFQELIEKQFCQVECSRYTHASGDPALTSAQRADALNIAQAAGHLRRWLNVVIQLGNQAESQREGIEEALLEARQEEEQADTQQQGGD